MTRRSTSFAFASLVALLGLETTAAAQADPCAAEKAKLLSSDGEAYARFGANVAVEGDTAFVGASSQESPRGAAYVFARSGSSWVQRAKLEPLFEPAGFGGDLDLDGDTVLIGATGEDGNQPTCGSVYVFVRSALSWNVQSRLLADDGGTHDAFGAAVSLDGDTALVGAYRDTDFGLDSGSAYVFVRTGTTWTQQAKLAGHDLQINSRFGNAVALSGDTALVAAYTDNHLAVEDGAVYVFERTGSAWSEQTKLVPPDPSYHSYFGTSLVFDGETALVGRPRDDEVAEDAGAVFAFVRTGSTWNLQAKLTSASSVHIDWFGSSLAFSGERLLVGAPNGHAHGERPGTAYWFERVGTNWIERNELIAADGAQQDRFGTAVALDGDTACVGARLDANENGSQAGSAYVYSLPLEIGTTYCTCPAGPCGNSDPSAGCANSTGAGAALVARGRTHPDELNLFVTGARPNQFGIFIQGDNVSLLPFGDGFRCTSGSIVRITPLPVLVESDGSLGYGPCFGDPQVSASGGVTPGSGVTKRYQFWYRDPNGPCASGFNLTNGLELVW